MLSSIRMKLSRDPSRYISITPTNKSHGEPSPSTATESNQMPRLTNEFNPHNNVALPSAKKRHPIGPLSLPSFCINA